MHILIVFVDLRSICLRCETGKTLLKHIDTQRLITSYKNIDSQIKFMSIDEKGVGDITRDDRSVINVNVIYIVNNIDTFALT